VKGVRSQDPDLIESYNNLDSHPNIAKVCIDGVAFATTTRTRKPLSSGSKTGTRRARERR
jgi:hypothetical protein